MEEFNTNWSQEELKAYILLYCSNADFEESKPEMNYIKSKLTDLNIDAIHAEYEEDNDYQSIQKIRSTLNRLEYNKDRIDALEKDIKELFLVDGEYDTLEKNLFIGLKRILES